MAKPLLIIAECRCMAYGAWQEQKDAALSVSTRCLTRRAIGRRRHAPHNLHRWRAPDRPRLAGAPGMPPHCPNAACWIRRAAMPPLAHLPSLLPQDCHPQRHKMPSHRLLSHCWSCPQGAAALAQHSRHTALRPRTWQPPSTRQDRSGPVADAAAAAAAPARRCAPRAALPPAQRT